MKEHKYKFSFKSYGGKALSTNSQYFENEIGYALMIYYNAIRKVPPCKMKLICLLSRGDNQEKNSGFNKKNAFIAKLKLLMVSLG